MGEGRFRSFTTGYKDTDLWIGIDPGSYREEMKEFCYERVKIYRIELENWLSIDPQFGKSLIPYKPSASCPEMAMTMALAAQKAGVGPMAAVAGAFSERLGNDLKKNFPLLELAIENGGDIFLHLINPLVLSVYAGKSELSGKVGIQLPVGMGDIGICTSAGTVGPSWSFGKADAVMVACKNTALADAWATALGNRVVKSEDIEPVLNFTEHVSDILSVVIICSGKVGIRGKFELKIIDKTGNR
jgi:ApbE superfamily uncharacterized protein (UPF0280 family)